MSNRRRSATWPLPGATAIALCALACPGQLPPPPPPPDAGAVCVDGDGFADAMGSGHVFLLDEFGFADASDCLDRDGDGTPDCAINRAWRPLGPVLGALLNGAVANGRILLAVEVAGLCVPYDGSDPAVTLKIYPTADADSDPVNNLCGAPGCGRMLARSRYLVDGQTRYRAQPRPVDDYTVTSAIEDSLTIQIAAETEPMTVRSLVLQGLLPEQMLELPSGVLCGVAPVREMALVQLPICDSAPVLCQQALLPPDLSLAEYLAVLGTQPDVDVDGDGFERFELDANNRVLICYDGDGSVLGAKDCLQDPEMLDGYSVCFALHGVPAAIVGTYDG